MAISCLGMEHQKLIIYYCYSSKNDKNKFIIAFLGINSP
ncbi:hypothetical protein LPE509_00715 [Legionella pneumophila subsp. pneumophila LPE509]|nr:hypothetical protein LPE509_00715 [Legionella pneumophila subsp. pneumophila LPE509]